MKTKSDFVKLDQSETIKERAENEQSISGGYKENRSLKEEKESLSKAEKESVTIWQSEDPSSSMVAVIVTFLLVIVLTFIVLIILFGDRENS